nr:type IV secretion system DNA-binding domain-containing protein [Sulfolobus islandicus]
MMWGKKEQIDYKIYELFPRVNENVNILNALGHVFEIIYSKDKEFLHIYVKTPAQPEVLRQYFAIKEDPELKNPKFVGKVLLKNEKDFYWGIEVNDFTNVLTKLQENEQLRIWIILEPKLNDILLRYADKLKRNQSAIGKRQREVLASKLESYAKDNLYYIQPFILSDTKDRIKLLSNELRQYILTRSKKLRLEIKKTKDWDDEQPTIPRFWSLKYKRWIWTDEEKIGRIAVIPRPGVLSIKIATGALLPDIVPQRTGATSFRIGQTVLSGKEVRLELEDFYRHAYIIGKTGAGKTSAIRILIKRIKETNPDAIIVLMDPHGDVARELLSFFATYKTDKFDLERQLFYFHPIDAPIAINPLALPKLPNIEQAKLIGFGNTMEIFNRLFVLKEGAVYVKYVIQSALQLLYQKTSEPTFYDLYRIILGLRKGTIDLPIQSEEWQEKLEQFQELDETTFISALSRIEMIATNGLLRKIFSRNIIDDNQLFGKGNVIIINATEAAVTKDVSFTIMAAWLFKIWYYVLMRYNLDLERIPIVTFIDEFENVADFSLIDVVLTEARKMGLHLVLAHQHTGQVSRDLLKSILNNTGVKLLLQIAGDDAKIFSETYPTFSSELNKVLPEQGVGEAVLIVTKRKDEIVTPLAIKIDYEDFKKDKDAEKRILERMAKYVSGVVEEHDITELVNPIMKYIERPNVLEQQILFNIYISKTENGNHSIYLVDLLKKIGIDRDKVEDIINKLEATGYISVDKVKNKKLLTYGKGLFGDVKAAAPSDEGRRLAMKVMLRYMRNKYYITPAKQSPNLESRPDLVAIPFDSNFVLDYSKAVAIEIESCNEISVHPEQVIRNWRKESVKDFSEVHSWTYEECFDKLQQLYDQLSDEEKKKVKIFAVKIKKQKLGQPTQKETKPETGEFTTAKSKQETTAQGAPITAANTNDNKQQQKAEEQIIAATDDGKLGSLLKIGHLEFQVLDEVNDKVIVKTGDKDYKISKKDLIDLEGLSDLIVEAKIENNYLKVKTSLGLTQKFVLEPL